MLQHFQKDILITLKYQSLMKNPYYQVNDINTLVRFVAHTYHPDKTDPNPPFNYVI